MRLIPYSLHSIFATTVNCGGTQITNQACASVPGGTYPTGLPTVTAGFSQVHTILQLAFGAIGAIALIIIIIAGLELVTSDGNPKAAASARNTIIYAAVGLLIALSAEVLVTYVLNNI